MQISEVDNTPIELARVGKAYLRFRLSCLKRNGLENAVSISKMDYRQDGDDFRAGMVNMPIDVAVKFARIVLAEFGDAEVAK